MHIKVPPFLPCFASLSLYPARLLTSDGHEAGSSCWALEAVLCAQLLPPRFSSMQAAMLQDGNTDIQGIRDAIATAKSVTDKPTLIKVLSQPRCWQCTHRDRLSTAAVDSLCARSPIAASRSLSLLS